MNERTGRNISEKYISNLKYGYVVSDSKTYFDVIRDHNLFNAIKREIINTKGKKIPKGFIICSRCGGSGKHSYNQKDMDMCYGCNGKGYVKNISKLLEI